MAIILYTLLMLFNIFNPGLSNEVSHTVTLSRGEVNNLKKTLASNEVKTMLEENKIRLTESFKSLDKNFNEQNLNDLLVKLSPEFPIGIPTTLRAFVALRGPSKDSDSKILDGLIKKLSEKKISLEEMMTLVNILYERLHEIQREEKEKMQTQNQIPQVRIDTLPAILKRPVVQRKPKPEEQKIFSELMKEVEQTAHAQLNNKIIVKSQDEPEKKQAVIGGDLHEVYDFDEGIDSLLKRYNILFKERSYLVQGQVTKSDMKDLLWDEEEKKVKFEKLLGSMKNQFPTAEEAKASLDSAGGDLVALLGFENIKRNGKISVSRIEDQIFLYIPVEIGPIKVVPKWALLQPSKMFFYLRGEATMTVDEGKKSRDSNAVLDSFNLDPLIESEIQYHHNISPADKRQLTKKLFRILREVSIESFLRSVLQDTVKISSIINRLRL